MQAIKGFEKPHTRWLSNFYPCTIDYQGISYPSSEHAYQAAKTLDNDQRRIIAACGRPGNAKKLGQAVKMRKNWNIIKRGIMKDILRIKFAMPGLAKALLDTGNLYLEETNWWGDTYWGVCGGKGENNLGKLLMEIRDEIRHPCYKPENAGKLKQLRALERKQRRGLLKQGGYMELLKLKHELEIGMH